MRFVLHPTQWIEKLRRNPSSFMIMASSTSNPLTGVGADAITAQSQATATPIPNQPLPEDGELEADQDSALGSVSGHSETTSLTSSVVKGYIENGRRYQTVREGRGQYFVPSDDKQFESIKAGHLAFIILESQRTNPLFRSPIDEEKIQNILDLGTGDGAWAIDVADRYPQATVHGVDLYPPPEDWVPPNCILEVDDITKTWTFKNKFDLIHCRQLLGSFSFADWDKVYKSAYDNLEPGGWFEHVEQCIQVACDDGSCPPDAKVLNTPKVIGVAADASGNPTNVYETMKERIEKAGFINIQEKVLKMPIGDWPRHPVYKDVGKCMKEHFLSGMEGWAMWLLTKFGKPEPWSVDEVNQYLSEMRAEIEDPKHHLYQNARRVWAQRPYDSQPKAARQQPVTENVESA